MSSENKTGRLTKPRNSAFNEMASWQCDIESNHFAWLDFVEIISFNSDLQLIDFSQGQEFILDRIKSVSFMFNLVKIKRIDRMEK